MIVNDHTTKIVSKGRAWSKWYIWQTVRNLNSGKIGSRAISIVLDDPDQLLVAADLCREAGLPAIETLLKELATPDRIRRSHAKNVRHITTDGSVVSSKR